MSDYSLKDGTLCCKGEKSSIGYIDEVRVVENDYDKIHYGPGNSTIIITLRVRDSEVKNFTNMTYLGEYVFNGGPTVSKAEPSTRAIKV